MDKVIDARFERVEKALAILITSISTYNASPGHANDLVNADAELNQGLQQLAQHQANYTKILALRKTSSYLDSQIRDTLTLLTTTRSSLIATPATVFPEKTNPVSYSELLSYARRISKFTRPPGYRENDSQGAEVVEGAATGNGTPKDNKSDTHTNGTSTPITAANGIEKDAIAMDIDMPGQGQSSTSQALSSQTTNTVLPTQITAWLDPLADQNYVPWPTEDKLRRGALASIQLLLDRGLDPATFDPEKSVELEAERKRVMEEEDLLREQEQERMDLERRREMERRMSVSSAGGGGAGVDRAVEKPKAFSLETFDDDDDDE